MVEDGNTETKTNNTTGQEGDKNNKSNPASDQGNQVPSDLDRAEAANKEKEKLLEQESKLLDRKEKLQAIQMVGGHTVTGQEQAKKEETAEEYTERFERGEINLAE